MSRSDNYEFVYSNGTLSIGSVNTELTVASIESKTYGDLPFALPSVTTNNNRGEITYTVADEGIAVISEGRIYIKGVGKTSLIVRQAATETYSSAEVEVGFTVSKAVLTVTAENKECRQGDEMPGLTYVYKGFVTGDPAERGPSAARRRHRYRSRGRPADNLPVDNDNYLR